MDREINKNSIQIGSFERALATRFSKEEAENWFREYSGQYKELMTYYRCALMEVETKFKVLNEDFSLLEDNNPIENIKSRLKKPESIVDKMIKNDYPLTIDSLEENLTDIAGIRIICPYQSDIYRLKEAILSQDDIVLFKEKDYIQSPKPSGYRSLHLIIGVPIFLHNEKKVMKVEVQFRTLAMDMWASLEHKMKYKKDFKFTDDEICTLHGCAELSNMLDLRMEELYKSITGKK